MNCKDPRHGERLRAHGLRSTEPRCLILAALEEGGNHLSPDEIQRLVLGHGARVSTATLYQNLNRLAEVGVLVRFTGLDGLIRFDANTSSHHHLVCVSCSRVLDVGLPMDPSLLKGLRPVQPSTGLEVRDWQIEGGQLELKGLCPACRDR